MGQINDPKVDGGVWISWWWWQLRDDGGEGIGRGIRGSGFAFGDNFEGDEGRWESGIERKRNEHERKEKRCGRQ